MTKYKKLIPEANEIYKTTEDLVSIGVRMPGTAGGDKARQYVKDRFYEYGLKDVHEIESETDLWQCSEYELTVDDKEVPAYFIAHSFNNGSYGEFGTPDEGLNGEMVYVGDGKSKDFDKVDVKGKIVVCNCRFTKLPIFMLRIIAKLFYDPDRTLGMFERRLNPYSANTFPHNYYRAMKRGAAGCIVILSDYIDSNCYNNEDYSYIDGDMKIPGLWVSRDEGKKLVERIKGGLKPAAGSIRMKCSNSRIKAAAVAGIVQGKTDEMILVHSHFDSSTPGATEDGTGAAEVLALAKYFSQIPREELKKSILFIEMDTHFSDYDTHDSVVAEYMGEGSKVLADVCIEHVAAEMINKNGTGVMTGLVEPRIFFVSGAKALMRITKDEIKKHDLRRTVVLPAEKFGDEVPTDGDIFHVAKVPIINMVSGQLYIYDNIDTMDKVPKGELRPVAETFADIIWRLMDLDRNEFR